MRHPSVVLQSRLLLASLQPMAALHSLLPQQQALKVLKSLSPLLATLVSPLCLPACLPSCPAETRPLSCDFIHP